MWVTERSIAPFKVSCSVDPSSFSIRPSSKRRARRKGRKGTMPGTYIAHERSVLPFRFESACTIPEKTKTHQFWNEGLASRFGVA